VTGTNGGATNVTDDKWLEQQQNNNGRVRISKRS
jgi:hypothetical protein